MSENSSSDESSSKRSQAKRASKESAAAAASRLKRVAPSQKDSKLARLSRARRANTSPVKHPRDLLGVSLADGRYVVKAPLGKGSMAYVFRVSDARLQTDVVLKVPKPEKVNTADFRERFHRESQMLIRFSHPHVVKVLDVGEYAELPYVVMQLLEGGSLSDRIANESDDNGRMSPESLKSWIREVARALDFCYRKGMIHRDVKPANILFDEDKNAYVGDFGLSKIMGGEHAEMSSDETAAGVVLGTPNYISPEVVQGKDYDGRSDQYSLGITIYHVLTGGPPMQGNTATMTMLNQTQMVLPLLSDVRDDVPRPLAVAVRKAIEKDPARRFNTCVEFAEAVIEGLRFAPVISTSSNSSSLTSSKSASASSRKLRSQPVPESAAKPSTKSDIKSLDPAATRKQRKAVSPKSSGKKKVSSTSKARRAAASGQSSRSSRSSKRTVSAASSAVSLEADMDWFDMDCSGDHPVGRSSSSSRSSGSRSSSRSASRRRSAKAKTAESKLISVFGQQLHPIALVALAVCGVFAFAMNVWSPWAADESSPELVAGQYFPAQQTSSANNQKRKALATPNGQRNEGRPMEKAVATSRPKTEVATGNQQNQSQPLVGESSPDGLAASLADQSFDVASSDPAATSAIVQFLAAQESRPIFALPAGTSTRFGDGTAELFVTGRSIRSRKTGKQTAVLSGDYAASGLTTLSNDGNWFAATMTERTDREYRVRVWNTKTGSIELEVTGDGRRVLRNLFVSDKYLYLETDRSQQLQAWNLTSKRQQGVLTLPAERLRSQRMGMTREGTAFAAVVDNKLSIINGVSGVVTTQLDSPLPAPVQVAMTGSSSLLSRSSPAKMLQSLSGLQFSNDQLQLAAVRTMPESALMAWNELGHLQHDLVFPLAASRCEPTAIQWFDNRNAWLINGSVIDATHRKVVVAVPHSDQQAAMVALQDDDHLMTTIRTDVTNVYRRQIPWMLIDDSLAVMADDDTSMLKPGLSVRLSIEIDDGSGSGVVLKPMLENAIQKRLASEQISIADNAPLKFKLTARQGLQQEGEETVLELIDAQTSRLIWYAVLGQSLDVQADDFAARRLIAETITERIASLAIPYYVPSDPNRIMLPYFIDE